jgi:hypothetical protein
VVVIDAFGARWALDVSALDDPLARELVNLWDRATVTPGSGDPVAEDACPPFVVARTPDGQRRRRRAGT